MKYKKKKSRPPRWSSCRRSRLLTRETGFKPRVGQVNTSCHRLVIDAALHCVPWLKLQRWAPQTRYTLTGTKDEYNENLI